ncbi:hypothetical protein G6F59_016988 [Rhizopus arrhizus]|nr:hypothetical protein G6F59_016988 [Rhizopus arrhizus]
MPAAAPAPPNGRCHRAAEQRRGGWRCAARSCLRCRPAGCPAPGAIPGSRHRPTASAFPAGRAWPRQSRCRAVPAHAARAADAAGWAGCRVGPDWNG